MNFDLDPLQEMLRETLTRYLQAEYDFDARRAAARSERGWSVACWDDLATRLGVLGAGLPADRGGLGGGAVEHMVIMEALGQALALEPYLDTVVIGGGMLKRSAVPEHLQLLASIADGSVTLAFAHAEPLWGRDPGSIAMRAVEGGGGFRLDGEKVLVRNAAAAAHLIVTAQTESGIGLFLIENGGPGITIQNHKTHDGGRASVVRFDSAIATMIAPDHDQQALLDTVLDEAAAASCAEAVGIMRRLVAETLAYTKQRRQFGQPIAEFQALQHRMADMAMHLERAAAMTLMATLKLVLPAEERARAVSAAKVVVGQACRFIGQAAIQLHGGIGLTDELPVAHYFKRATLIEHELGGTAWHLARYAQLAAAAASSH